LYNNANEGVIIGVTLGVILGVTLNGVAVVTIFEIDFLISSESELTFLLKSR